MRRQIITIIAAGLLAAGCSGESGNDKPEPKATAEATAQAAAETRSAAPALSKEWETKLDDAGDKGGEGVCTEVGSEACVKHLTQLTEVVYDVEAAITEAGADTLYPRSMKHIDEVEAASTAFVEAECKGSTDNALGDSACAGYAATLLLGPATLSMTMTTDELSAR
jgi:hypothetical protein